VLHLAVKGSGVTSPSFAHRAVIAAGALAVALLVLYAVGAGPVVAQDATPGLLPPTDPRSEGEGPGFGSGPLVAAAVVLVLGILAALLTIAYVRLMRRN
jgi:hypothetical protein